jgi:hypothetical protein
MTHFWSQAQMCFFDCVWFCVVGSVSGVCFLNGALKLTQSRLFEDNERVCALLGGQTYD